MENLRNYSEDSNDASLEITDIEGSEGSDLNDTFSSEPLGTLINNEDSAAALKTQSILESADLEIQSIQEFKPGERWYEYKRRCLYGLRFRIEASGFKIQNKETLEKYNRRAYEIKEANYRKYGDKRWLENNDLPKDFWT